MGGGARTPERRSPPPRTKQHPGSEGGANEELAPPPPASAGPTLAPAPGPAAASMSFETSYVMSEPGKIARLISRAAQIKKENSFAPALITRRSDGSSGGGGGGGSGLPPLPPDSSSAASEGKGSIWRSSSPKPRPSELSGGGAKEIEPHVKSHNDYSSTPSLETSHGSNRQSAPVSSSSAELLGVGQPLARISGGGKSTVVIRSRDPSPDASSSLGAAKNNLPSSSTSGSGAMANQRSMLGFEGLMNIGSLFFSSAAAGGEKGATAAPVKVVASYKPPAAMNVGGARMAMADDDGLGVRSLAIKR